MSSVVILGIALALCLVVIGLLAAKLWRTFQQLTLIEHALTDIKAGNWNRRVLADENDRTKIICYGINELAVTSQSQFAQLKKSEQAYKRLMTSLSHDVKTPLTSMVGYLEAVQEEIVTGAEQAEYIEVALNKAHQLKDFVEALFDWVKLDAKEQIFQPQPADINELTRHILADWIPTFEEQGFQYQIKIPDCPCMVPLDAKAYLRILNNLLQNALVHSAGTQLEIELGPFENKIRLEVRDNGQGIAAQDLPHIFERLYQSDDSRGTRGNGLGLAIAKELTHLHKGSLTAENLASGGMGFTLILPQAL